MPSLRLVLASTLGFFVQLTISQTFICQDATTITECWWFDQANAISGSPACGWCQSSSTCLNKTLTSNQPIGSTCGNWQPDLCAEQTDAMACFVADAAQANLGGNETLTAYPIGCGWCGDSQQCLAKEGNNPRTQQPACPGQWTPTGTCSLFASCSACAGLAAALQSFAQAYVELAVNTSQVPSLACGWCANDSACTATAGACTDWVADPNACSSSASSASSRLVTSDLGPLEACSFAQPCHLVEVSSGPHHLELTDSAACLWYSDQTVIGDGSILEIGVGSADTSALAGTSRCLFQADRVQGSFASVTVLGSACLTATLTIDGESRLEFARDTCSSSLACALQPQL